MAQSSFAADFAADVVPDAYAEFGEDITYTPTGGSAKTIKAIAIRESFGEGPSLDGRGITRTGIIRIRSDATLGIAAPDRRDKVTIDAIAWGVAKIETTNAGEHILDIERFDAVEKGRPDYRMNR